MNGHDDDDDAMVAERERVDLNGQGFLDFVVRRSCMRGRRTVEGGSNHPHLMPLLCLAWLGAQCFCQFFLSFFFLTSITSIGQRLDVSRLCAEDEVVAEEEGHLRQMEELASFATPSRPEETRAA
jgi:hypothetical protein